MSAVEPERRGAGDGDAKLGGCGVDLGGRYRVVPSSGVAARSQGGSELENNAVEPGATVRTSADKGGATGDRRRRTVRGGMMLETMFRGPNGMGYQYLGMRTRSLLGTASGNKRMSIYQA
jgi:hypothetical protein